MTDRIETQRPPHRSLLERLSGVFLLDGGVFDDIENDRSALPWAAGIVILAGLARGAGAPSPSPSIEIIGSGLAAMVMWLVAGLVVWGTGVQRMGYTSNYPELLRTIGFAAVPLMLLVLRVLPIGAAGLPLWVVAHAWAFLALIVAIREALDIDTKRATVVCLLSLGTAVAIVAGLSAVLLVARPVS